MNRNKSAILIVFLIFLVNIAAAPAVKNTYESITLTPGEELSQKLSFSGTYKRLFATADASGNAALWVTPRRINFGTLDPGETIKKEYSISIPRSQKPGYYELVWKYSCKYTDGSTCAVTSDTVVRITVEAGPAQTSSGVNKKSLTIGQGEELKDYLTFSARSDEYGLYAWADASGTAASWVKPQRIDFGTIQPGDSIDKYYTIRAPQNQRTGDYELVWTWGCGYTSRESCEPVTGVTILQITVDAKSRPVYTPATSGSDDDMFMVFIFIFIISIIFFVVWIYVLIWVVRDANKRGKSGPFWGFLTFFLGILGLILYLLARPGGNLVLCNSCGKQKLEALILCPHCRSPPKTGFRPVSVPMTAPPPMSTPHPASSAKPEVSIDELKKQKEKLNKITTLLDKLDERLAQGEITEARYTQMREQYEEEAEKLKNQITEKELMKEVGL
jgi:uncharacterized membrane protein